MPTLFNKVLTFLPSTFAGSYKLLVANKPENTI